MSALAGTCLMSACAARGPVAGSDAPASGVTSGANPAMSPAASTPPTGLATTPASPQPQPPASDASDTSAPSGPATSSAPTARPAVDFNQLCHTKIGADTQATGQVTINHQAWGPTTIVSCGPTPTGDPGLHEGALAVDGTGAIRWRTSEQAAGSFRFALASPATDASGNVFIIYNPGRYDGIMILRPTATGIQILVGTYFAPTELSFYSADLVGPGSDGLYQIRQYANDCVPDCARGTTTSQTFAWNGATYVPQ